VRRPLAPGSQQDQPVSLHHVCGSTLPGQEGLCIIGEPRTGGETNTPPNIAVEPTPSSVRSCLASAFGRGSPRAFGFAPGDKQEST
jgi:hypothetical protein